jgi:hypothetical protein
MATDHPLLTLIEDPYHSSDVQGVKNFITKAKDKNPNLQICIKAMFIDGNLEKLEQLTQLVPVPVVEEQEVAEGEEEEPKEPVEPVEDPNKDKFVPHLVHMDRTIESFMTVSDQLKLFEFVGQQLNDSRFGVIFDDAYFETSSGDLYDLYYGIGCAFLNVKGI